MHVKVLVVDDLLAITGGRNYQNRYYDWDSGYNYRDRDVLVGGPVARTMREGFDAFWNDRQAIPIARLHDVAREILREEGVPDRLPAADRTSVVEGKSVLVRGVMGGSRCN